MLQIQGQTRWIGHSVTLRSAPEDPNPTLHTQEVTGSSPVAPTIVFNSLRTFHFPTRNLCPLCVRNLSVAQHSVAANRAELGSLIWARNRQIRRCYLKNFLRSALRRPPCGLTRAAVDGGASTRSCRRHSAHGGHHEPALLEHGGVSLEEARLEVEVPARPRSTQTPAIRWALVTIVGCGAIPDRPTTAMA